MRRIARFTPQEFARAIGHLGIKATVSSGRDPACLHSWTGRKFDLVDVLDESDLIHELAHWLVAPKSLRRTPNFGLGADNEHSCKSHFHHPHDKAEVCSCQKMSYKESHEHEALASLLGIYIERDFGMPHMDTWCYHSWEYARENASYIRKLRSMGLISRKRAVVSAALRARLEFEVTETDKKLARKLG